MKTAYDADAKNMNSILRTLFFTSALSPAVVVSAIVQLATIGGTKEIACWLLASTIACIFPILIVEAANKKLEAIPFSAKKVESQDWLLIVFVVSYFIPLVSKVNDITIFIPVFIIAAFLLATIDAIPCHPVLHALRYRFYKVEGMNGAVYTLISRRKLRTAADIKNIKQISHQLLMES